MTQFFFTLTNVEAEALLKEEIRIRYPELRMSYSRPGFITFKGEKDIVFRPYFCRVSGLSQGKFKKSELKLGKAWVYALNETLTLPEDLKVLTEQSHFRPGERVTLVVMAGEDEFWVGTYTQLKTHFQTPGEVSSIIEKDAPSRAYYKIAEAYEAFDLPFENQELVLELGSSPGGASLFLLEQDMRVLGVDPADMDPVISKKFDFKHLRKPFEHLTENDFRSNIDWILSDINLPPTIVLREVFRLMTFLEPRGLLLTLKINEMKHLEIIATIRDKIRAQGFTKVELKYLPSHRKEIALIAIKD